MISCPFQNSKFIIEEKLKISFTPFGITLLINVIVLELLVVLRFILVLVSDVMEIL